MATRRAKGNPAVAPVRHESGATRPLRARPRLASVPMPKTPLTARATRTFRKGTRIPGSNLVLSHSIRTVARKLPKGYGIDLPGWNEWAFGDSWDEAMHEFLTSLRDGLTILSRMEGELDAYEQARLAMFRHYLGRAS